jgi:stearoyl-CoA desaturase (delta-9 desaturase)
MADVIFGRRWNEGVSWGTTIIMAAYHAGAVAALFFFSWKALALAVILTYVAGSFGIGMGYHRLLTHRGYKTRKWVEYFLTLCGTLALEGGPIFWVGLHRIHHQNSDKEGDPHTPRDGKWWSHMGWILMGEALHDHIEELGRYTPDLKADRFHVLLTKYHYVPTIVLGLVILAIGGWPYVLWAMCLRTVVTLHCTWMVNSVTHMWGTRRFATRDDSTNNPLIAMVTFGEGWHNNHHAHPISARHGLAWYEVDLNWYGIWILSKLGLAWDIKIAKLPPRESVQTAKPAKPELISA